MIIIIMFIISTVSFVLLAEAGGGEGAEVVLVRVAEAKLALGPRS